LNDIPELAQIASAEFQEFIDTESKKWNWETSRKKGKMFGVLVVQKTDKSYAYLGTVSGKLPGNAICDNLLPSIFEVSTDDYFFDSGMTELSEIGLRIAESTDSSGAELLRKERKKKSIALQHRLFENYHFLNLSKKQKNLLEIFEDSIQSYPPSAAGECAAPKLLHYAIKWDLKPIAIAEFWWGEANPNNEREHLQFYPACESKCRPILEYMLEASLKMD